jgi:2-haloacid dehalogenase
VEAVEAALETVAYAPPAPAFDVYGTLIDWESGMIAGLKPLTDRIASAGRVAGAPLTRDDILEAHALHESTAQAQTSGKLYAELLAVVYKRQAEEWRVAASWDECLTYDRGVRNWPAFPDSADALAHLKDHYMLAVLSNVDNAGFAASHAKLGVAFDAVNTAEDIGSYKPAARNFDYMIAGLARRGIEKHEILHVAESMFHDHAPANRLGLANCWIYRRRDQTGFGTTMPPGGMPFTFNSMADLAAAHRAELAGPAEA